MGVEPAYTTLDGILCDLKTIRRFQIALHRIQIRALKFHVPRIILNVDRLLTDIQCDESIGGYTHISFAVFSLRALTLVLTS
jgi:hypothetical protein